MILPTPYEISRIAVALRVSSIVKNPIEAVRTALGLWFIAAHELEEKAGKLENPTDGMRVFPVNKSHLRIMEETLDAENEEYERERQAKIPKFKFGTSLENSEVLKWLENNGVPFKRFSGLQKAWKKVFGENEREKNDNCTEAVLREFMKLRRDAELKSDRDRKKDERKSKAVEKKVSNKSEKISTGSNAPVQRKKPVRQ